MSMEPESRLSQLQSVLAEAGKQTILYDSPDGSRVLQLLHGGRILGLFSGHDDRNFYWTHPALESLTSAQSFYSGNNWHNSGGDRTWLSPEVDIFFPKYPDLDLSTYWQPRALDPGAYRLHSNRMVNTLSLTLSRAQKQADVEIAKWVGPASNPLRYEKDWRSREHLTYAGYTQHTALRLMRPSESMIGLWNLVQMPHGGELQAPTFGRAEVKVYMGEIGSDDISVSDGLFRYRMRAAGEHKIGLRAASVTGRVGYLYERDEEASLIVRNFFVNPSGEYVDVPWQTTEDFGYAVQACNVNSQLGAFSELEYHVPAIGGETGLDYCEDVSQIWAFRGPTLRVHQAARMLLS
ncbi:MAG TPA: hypothetical protein VEX68_29315 [Bryobacteraceae bacterium]|nr:hypothetical protein [Bryobacteraceae bacterium]